MRGALLAWALAASLLPGPAVGEGRAAPPRGPLAPALAQDPAPDSLPQPGESLRVFLLTLGQGDAVWERFGHNAIWIQDEATGEGAAYNWGIFSFLQEGFILRLIQGTMMYWMAPQDPYAMLEEAQGADRQVWIQELDLPPAWKLDLLAFVQWNARPENALYRYDYYRDNCSTRVRDALDRVLEGRIRAASDTARTPHTYRWHTRRLLQGLPASYLGIQVVLGPDADRPLTAWEEMFLPTRLMEGIRGLELPDGGGGTRPLVVQERALRESARPPEPPAPPLAFPWFLGVGLLWGGGLVALVRKGRGGGWGWRAAGALLGAGWALLASVAGLLLLGAWLFTDHVFWFRNLNLLQMNPVHLPVAVGFGLYLARGRVPWWGRDAAAALAVVAMVGALMELLPGLGQGNGEILALTLPVNLGLWAAAQAVVERRARLRSSPGPEEAGGGSGAQGGAR